MLIKTKINGETWALCLISAKQMKSIRGKNLDAAAALCVPEERTIYFDWDCVDFKTVAHELFHAYWSDLHLDDTNNITLADAEEIAANLVSVKGERMLRQARKLTKKLKVLADE